MQNTLCTKKIYGCTTKGKDIFQIVSCLKIVEKIVGRKQLLWFTDGVCLSIREQKKKSNFLYTAIFWGSNGNRKGSLALAKNVRDVSQIRDTFFLISKL